MTNEMIRYLLITPTRLGSGDTLSVFSGMLPFTLSEIRRPNYVRQYSLVGKIPDLCTITYFYYKFTIF